MQLTSKKEKSSGNSPYAKKKAAGNQMYGPGCCANSLTDPQMQAIRRRAMEAPRNPAAASPG